MTSANLYTFELIDGRRVTYAGETEKQAFWRATDFHRHAVAMKLGTPAVRCTCELPWASSSSESGYRTCNDCGGYLT